MQESLTIFFIRETMPKLRRFTIRPNAPGLAGKVRFTTTHTAAVRKRLSGLCKNCSKKKWDPFSSWGKSSCITASLWNSLPLAILLRIYIPCMENKTKRHIINKQLKNDCKVWKSISSLYTTIINFSS